MSVSHYWDKNFGPIIPNNNNLQLYRKNYQNYFDKYNIWVHFLYYSDGTINAYTNGSGQN